MKEDVYSLAQVADILGVSKETLRRWDNSGKLVANRSDHGQYRFYEKSQLERFEQAQDLFTSRWSEEETIRPKKPYSLVELFAGAGGLALGLEHAGFESLLLNEIDKSACETLVANRPEWDVRHADVSSLSFKEYVGGVDLLTGGFPCQAFSYAGKKLGFRDVRGTLFFEFARAVSECQPKVIVAENVRGLLRHDGGRTIRAICDVIDEIGYELVEPRVLKAVFFKVPQKRERLFLVAVRKDLAHLCEFKWPSPFPRILTLRDALKAGELFNCDVPASPGQNYPERKREVLKMVPPGGYWRDLPIDVQKEYMMKSFYLGGGKTGMARRLSWDEPSLTLTCAPAQKQTERCHPEQTRPLTVREYARVQTFPDDWFFSGSLSSQYKQIGNAVPVNLAAAVGRSVARSLDSITAAGY